MKTELQNFLELNIRSFRACGLGSRLSSGGSSFQCGWSWLDRCGQVRRANVVRTQIREAKKLTDKPFGVNIMLLSPYAEEVAHIVVEEGVKVVTTGAGNPGKYMEMWKAAGIKVVPVVASVALAKMMEKAGADAVVAEGTESGWSYRIRDNHDTGSAGR